MPLFNWFSRKSRSARPGSSTMPPASKARDAAPKSAATPGDAPRATVATSGATGNRKAERLERRELLYGIVRQSMTRAGVLTASYKFKVLSLDPPGRQYLIMMDLANHMAGETGRLTEIEALIAQSARTRHDIVVTAVYWRVNEQGHLGLSRSKASATDRVSVSRASESWVPQPRTVPRYDPMHSDEVTVLRQVAAAGAPVVALAGSGEILPSSAAVAGVASDFADTERVPRETRPSPLSGTQYGDLS